MPINGSASVAQSGSRNIADVTDTFGDLDGYRATGGKLLVGRRQQQVYTSRRASSTTTARWPSGTAAAPRTSAACSSSTGCSAPPGNGHCGGGAAPQIQDPFGVLVNWVEKGVAPNSGSRRAITVGGVTRTRPLCPYPQTAIYNGSGSTDDAANFHCGGNLDTQEILCESSRS